MEAEVISSAGLALDSRHDGGYGGDGGDSRSGLSHDHRLCALPVLDLSAHLTPRATDAEAGDQDVFTQTALKHNSARLTYSRFRLT